jgi:hypothetical protein
MGLRNKPCNEHVTRNPTLLPADTQVPSPTIPPDAVYIPRNEEAIEYESGSGRVPEMGTEQQYKDEYRTVNTTILLRKNASYLH